MLVTKRDVCTYLCHRYDTTSTKYQVNVQFTDEAVKRSCVIDLYVIDILRSYCLLAPILDKPTIRNLYELVKSCRLSGCSQSTGYRIIGCLPESDQEAKAAKELATYLRSIDHGVNVEFLDSSVVAKYRQFNQERYSRESIDIVVEDNRSTNQARFIQDLEPKQIVAMSLIAAGVVWSLSFATVSKIRNNLAPKPNVTTSQNETPQAHHP